MARAFTWLPQGPIQQFFYAQAQADFFRSRFDGEGEVLLFAVGITWLYALTHSAARAIAFGLYWFIFAEVMKVMLAAGIASTWRRFVSTN